MNKEQIIDIAYALGGAVVGGWLGLLVDLADTKQLHTWRDLAALTAGPAIGSAVALHYGRKIPWTSDEITIPFVISVASTVFYLKQ